MDEFKINKANMKNRFFIVFVVTCFFCSCQEIDIPFYDVKDSCVRFDSSVQTYSIKGMTEEFIDLKVPIGMIGPICDYDRMVAVQVVDSSANTAVPEVDFQVKEAIVKAGNTSGYMVLRVKNLPESVSSLNVVLKITPNEYFKQTFSNLNSSNIFWTADYSRPSIETVWKSWFYFFSPTYSKAYHKLLVEYFGTDLEKMSYESRALRDPDLIYKNMAWWYSASRDFYQMVKEHDAEHPDAPYMHSEDVMTYASWSLPDGSGQKPDGIPTILSTLLVN